LNKEYEKIYTDLLKTLAKSGFYGDELYEQARVMANAIYKQYLIEKNEVKGTNDE
jgi:hypothetical protein